MQITTDAPVPKSSSPRTPSYTYPTLTPSEQVLQDLENSSAAAQAQHEIDVDSSLSSSSSVYSLSSGSDTGYESDSLGSASTSLSSGVRDYAFENGRRYHKFREGAYNFPNDDSEQDREDMKHAMMVNLCQGLHFAPLGNGREGGGQNVLDMGTGTGIWAIESMLAHLCLFASMGGKGSADSVLQWAIYIQVLMCWVWI